MRLLPALLSLIALAGCDALLNSMHGDAGNFDPCNLAGGNASVAGSWTLRGTASRHDCDRATYNSDSVDVSSLGGALIVAQDDAGLLRLADPVPEGIEFSGTMRGSCVEFITSESGVRYEWGKDSGATVDRPQHISGKFEGEGPGTCTSTGSFSVEVAAP
jgi:hypothetical protein